jgi:hypothetical protein
MKTGERPEGPEAWILPGTSLKRCDLRRSPGGAP